MVNRHKVEAKELDESIKALLKSSKKADKAQVEARAIQMRFDLRAKQQEEEDSNEESTDVNTKHNAVEDNIKEEQSELEKIASKKAKAKKKQDKKKTKQEEKDSIKQQIQAENSGPSMRDIELSAINAKLLKDSLEVKSVISDGNCLYRAIADQLTFTRTDGDIHDHYSLRRLASTYIRDNADEFSPFLGLEKTDREFSMYCDRVASEVEAEWGGELELKALSCALQRTILIYSKDSPTLCMNNSPSNSAVPVPLRVTYHKHYFSLGEHYNSVQQLPAAAGAGNIDVATSIVSDMKISETEGSS